MHRAVDFCATEKFVDRDAPSKSLHAAGRFLLFAVAFSVRGLCVAVICSCDLLSSDAWIAGSCLVAASRAKCLSLYE